MLKNTTSNSKSETLNPKQAPNTQISNSKHYDLEDRTFGFARDVLYYVNALIGKPSNLEIGKQLARSSGSVGANYIEANESLSRKDFLMRIKISKKEAKESRYWLLLTDPKQEYLAEKARLVQESLELMKIFGAILEKSR